jgi:act minimal PKS chain-length factor (CLF/KS beta)
VIAVAGHAWRTPLGSSVDAVVSRLVAGEHGVEFTGGPRCAIPLGPASAREARFLDRLGLLAVETAREAMAGADVDAPPDRVGLFAAIGSLRPRWDDLLPALAGQRDDLAGLWGRGLSHLHPFWMLQHLSNNVHATLSIALGLRGDGATFAGAVAGAEALCAAARALEAGAIDAALVVACDSLLEPQTVADLGRRGVTCAAPAGGWRPPYDAAAAGIVPGEGAAAMVLTRAAGGRPLLSCAVGIDPDPLPSGEPRPERFAEVASLVANGEGIVDGAAAARPELDLAERCALAELLPRAARLYSTAASLGRLGAAACLVEVIAALELLRRRVLPPVAALERAPDGPVPPARVAAGIDCASALLLSGGAPGLVAAVHVEAA